MAVINLDGSVRTDVWDPDQFAAWLGQIRQDSRAATGDAHAYEREIRDEIENYLNSQNGWVTSSFVPGHSWTGTPYEHIHNAIGDQDMAGMCLGNFVCEALISSAKEWEVVSHANPGGTIYRRR